MESIILQNINNILKDAPESVLKKVLIYIEEITEDKNDGFVLSDSQKESLEKIGKRSYNQHTELDIFINEMNSKYGI